MTKITMLMTLTLALVSALAGCAAPGWHFQYGDQTATNYEATIDQGRHDVLDSISPFSSGPLY